MKRKKRYTETEFRTKKLVPVLNAHGVRVHKMTEKFKTGWPDLLIIHKGTGAVAFVETKVDSAEVTALQSETLRSLANDGCLTYVIRYINKDDSIVVSRIVSNAGKATAISSSLEVMLHELRRKGGVAL